MCNPLLFNCSPIHYPLLIDSAVERLHKTEGEVHLSQGAVQYLYEYGNAHRSAFEQALKPEQQKKLDNLSEALQVRLKVALKNSAVKDPNGNRYNPPRIDREALKLALDKNPLVS